MTSNARQVALAALAHTAAVNQYNHLLIQKAEAMGRAGEPYASQADELQAALEQAFAAALAAMAELDATIDAWDARVYGQADQ